MRKRRKNLSCKVKKNPLDFLMKARTFSQIAAQLRKDKYLHPTQLAYIPPEFLEGLEEELLVIPSLPRFLRSMSRLGRFLASSEIKDKKERFEKMTGAGIALIHQLSNEFFPPSTLFLLGADTPAITIDEAVERVAERLEEGAELREALLHSLQKRQRTLRAETESHSWEEAIFIQ